ncbi:lea domain protein [Colletotrichum karsti]|uniref:Lea domain protein n=1 Tax=Colletotrichum karsti TaxID=1095194 RepID=A0A9P6I6G8_9PEZI|nr:lea domain protein [Colletotrichum karsti]KAF9872875.1 lea domain protein [Colletotrichum karsti]
MSFLIEATGRRIATLPRVVPRAVTVAPRHFTTSTPAQKSATETVKDGLKTVDRKISDKLVDGINVGSTVASKVKEAGADVSQGKATGKAEELRGEAAGKAQELKGEAKGKINEAAGKAKGTADQVKKNL